MITTNVTMELRWDVVFFSFEETAFMLEIYMRGVTVTIILSTVNKPTSSESEIWNVITPAYKVINGKVITKLVSRTGSYH